MRKTPPDGPRWSNCYVWATWRYLRKGGYRAHRQSRVVRWKPHYMWARTIDGPWWGYVPIKPRRGLASVLHSLGFRGRIKQEKRRRS